jgi:hypothetical protein
MDPDRPIDQSPNHHFGGLFGAVLVPLGVLVIAPVRPPTERLEIRLAFVREIMRHTRIKSRRIMRSHDRESGWWLRNPTTSMTL